MALSWGNGWETVSSSSAGGAGRTMAAMESRISITGARSPEPDAVPVEGPSVPTGLHFLTIALEDLSSMTLEHKTQREDKASSKCSWAGEAGGGEKASW